jgi:hypothetical protein
MALDRTLPAGLFSFFIMRHVACVGETGGVIDTSSSIVFCALMEKGQSPAQSEIEVVTGEQLSPSLGHGLRRPIRR